MEGPYRSTGRAHAVEPGPFPTPTQDYVPPDTTSGTLTVDPGLVAPRDADQLPAVEDVPADPARRGVDTLWFNIQYEKVHAG